MKIIIITGSTRGIGFGFAHEFLKRGCSVVINGRSQAAVEKAVRGLAAQHDAARVFSHVTDVSFYEQVQGLWDAAKTKFGRVDVWINNAGMAHSDIPFWEQPVSVMQEVVALNLLGVMYGSKVAVTGMAAQGSGTVYNFEGLGSDGRLGFGLGIYGSTKAGERYFTRSLALDVKTRNLPVRVGSISPGIVITDLLAQQYAGREQEFERARRIFNILGDKVETVTPFIAEKVLAGDLNIQWLTGAKVAWRFMTAQFNKRNLFDDRVKVS